MSKGFKAYNPDQMFLMPPSLRDWLPEDHLAYFISDVVTVYGFVESVMLLPSAFAYSGEA